MVGHANYILIDNRPAITDVNSTYVCTILELNVAILRFVHRDLLICVYVSRPLYRAF